MKPWICFLLLLLTPNLGNTFQLPDELSSYTQLAHVCAQLEQPPTGFIEFITANPHIANWANHHIAEAHWNFILVTDIEDYWKLYQKYEAFFLALKQWISHGLLISSFPTCHSLLTFLESHPDMATALTNLLYRSDSGDIFIYQLFINLTLISNGIQKHGIDAYLKLFIELKKHIKIFNLVSTSLTNLSEIHLVFLCNILGYFLDHPNHFTGSLNIFTWINILQQSTPGFIETLANSSPCLNDFFFLASLTPKSAETIASIIQNACHSNYTQGSRAPRNITDRLRYLTILLMGAIYNILEAQGTKL